MDDLIKKILIESHTSGYSIHQRMPIPEWLWEMISIDFLVGLFKTSGKVDSILVVVDSMTTTILFILVRVDYNLSELVKVYVNMIVRMHRCLFL